MRLDCSTYAKKNAPEEKATPAPLVTPVVLLIVVKSL